MEIKTCESCAWLNEDTTEELRFCEEMETYVDPDEMCCKYYKDKYEKIQQP